VKQLERQSVTTYSEALAGSFFSSTVNWSILAFSVAENNVIGLSIRAAVREAWR